MSDGEAALKVLPLEVVEKKLSGIDADLKAIKDNLTATQESTGLALDERKDDLMRLTKALDEEILPKLEKMNQSIGEAKRLSSLDSSRGGLADEIKSLQNQVTFVNRGDGDHRYDPGDDRNQISCKDLITGVRLSNGTWFDTKSEPLTQLQNTVDDMILVHAMMSSGDNAMEYANNGGMRSLKLFKQFTAMSDVIFKADDLMDTAEISTWVPTHFTSQLFETIKIGLPEVNFFQEITMTGKTFDVPVDLSETEATIKAETTTISGANPFADADAQVITDSKVTFTAVKLRSRIVTSIEAEEDAVVAWLPLIRKRLVRNFQEAMADAIINGQKSAAIDTGGTHFGKANVPAGVDARLAWDGLRKFLNQNTSVPDTSKDASNADLSISAMRNARASMGEQGVAIDRMGWFHSSVSYLKLLNDTNVSTVEKIGGDRATIRTGQLAIADGIPQIVSRRMPVNENASGIIDGVTENRSTSILIRDDVALMGNRRRATAGMADYVATDAKDLVLFWRGDFQKLFAVTSPWISGVFNLKTV